MPETALSDIKINELQYSNQKVYTNYNHYSLDTIISASFASKKNTRLDVYLGTEIIPHNKEETYGVGIVLWKNGKLLNQ